MVYDVFEIDRAVLVAHHRNGRAAEKPELGVAGVLLGSSALFGNSFDVGEREEPSERIVVVYNKELVDAEMLVKESVGNGDGVCAEFLLVDRENVLAGRHGLGDRKRGVAFLYNASGEKPHKLVLPVDDGKVRNLKLRSVTILRTSPMCISGETLIGS